MLTDKELFDFDAQLKREAKINDLISARNNNSEAIEGKIVLDEVLNNPPTDPNKNIDNKIWKCYGDIRIVKLNKKAACILTISDNLITHEETTSEERQTAFGDMMEVALEAAISDNL